MLNDNQLNQVAELLQSLIPVYSDVIEFSLGTTKINLTKVFDNVDAVKKEVEKAKNKAEILKICEKHLKDNFKISKHETPTSDDTKVSSSVIVLDNKYMYTIRFYKFVYALNSKK